LVTLAAILLAACAPATGGKPIADVEGDAIFDPRDALFPQDAADTAEPETVADTSELDTFVAPDTTAPETTADTSEVDTFVAPDTTEVDTFAAPDTSSSCPEGQGCNDGDLCTVNDHCAGGVCVGGGAVCDDHLPCTIDSCNAGSCSHSQQAGTCVIDGICWSADQPNPADVCQRCTPSSTVTDWTEVAGCGLGEPCTYHADCVPERVCAQWSTTGQRVCSDPCSGASDCPGGQICTKLPGSAQVGFCEAPGVGLLDVGQPCTEDYQCASGLCDGLCEPLCLDEARCNPYPNSTCHGVGAPAQGLVASACGPDNGALANGQPCTIDGGDTIDSAYCASGHCDFMLHLASGGATVPPCVPLCKSELDCAPAQECNFVIRATATNPNVVPYDAAYDDRTYDVLTGCYNPGQYGPRAVGQACTQASQCGSNKCLPVDADTPGTSYCTTFCEFDAECPSDMECGLGVLNLVSVWLISVSEDYDQFAATYVRICKYPRD